MKLTNGTNKPVKFNHNAIKKEASQTGLTSIVEAVCNDGTSINIRQHNSGDWDIAVNDNHEDSYDNADEAVSDFIRKIQYHNGKS